MIPKFRAFDMNSKQMINSIVSIDFEFEHITFEVEEFINRKTYFREVTFMKSTGVYDKHGVEIFEGDIVKPRFGKPFVVKHFIFGQGVFKTALITSDGHGFDGIYHGSLVEVIGNVEQNHELLEDA